MVKQSESPEEQPNTGVLGRLGSWLSPWRGKGPSENVSSTTDKALKSEGEEENQKPLRLRAKNQEWEEEKEQSSNPNPRRLSRDIFPCEERDATQSAHRDGSIVSSTETAEGGPEEEEFVDCREKSIEQSKEREESSNGSSASGNPKKNASHLTHLSSEQGVVWDSDRAHAQPQAQRHAQAQAGRRLQVYLEETSVTHRGNDTCDRQEIVEVTKKNLNVLPKAKSSPSFDLSSSSTRAENKRTNVKSAVGAQSYYSAIVGVSLKAHIDSQSEPESEEQTDNMGRKNPARRKFRKNSQGDEGNSPQEQKPPTDLPVPEGIPTSNNSLTSAQGESPKTHMGESSANSSSMHNPTYQASPGGAEIKTSCPDTVKPLDNFQDSNSVIAASLACVVDRDANMEDGDSLYKVERKTETPESKRRSLKVSRSEVKLFTKNVPLNPKSSPARDTQEFKAPIEKNKDEAQDKPNTAIDARHQLKKIDEESKQVVGRIADKINLFERPAAGVNKQNLRIADVSPVRKATERVKADFVSLEKRSRSGERYEMARSSSSSPVRETPMTIKERSRNFTESSKSDVRPALSQKPAITGKSQNAASSVAVAASKSPELGSQGKPDTKEQIQKAKSEITLKPDGQDTTAVGVKISIPKEQPTDSTTNNTVALKTADQGTKPDSVETDVPAKGTGDSAELTNISSPQSKGPSRIGSRSKRRKGREPNSPSSPHGENKPDYSTSKPAVNMVDDTEEAEKVSLPSENTSEKQSDVPDTKQKACKKQLVVLDKQKKRLDSSFKKENIDNPLTRQEGFPEPSVNKDEPDSAAGSNGTKTTIDKDSAILPQKEEKAGGHSLLFTQRREKASKDSRETPASSPSPTVEQPTEKTSSMKQGPPVEHPKLDKELPTQSESKNKGKVKETNKKDTGQTPPPPNKDIEVIHQAERKDVDNLEKVEGEKTNQTERNNKDKPQPLLRSDKNTTKAKVSDSSAARDDERKNAERKDETQPVKVITKPEKKQTEPASQSSERTGASSDLPAQTQRVGRTKTTQPGKTAVCAVTQLNEPSSEKGQSKGEKATHVPSGLQTKSTVSSGTEAEPVVIPAESLPRSVSVEKTEKSPDDSRPHGANDAEFSSSESITKATTAAVKVTVKAADGTPALIAAQTVPEKKSSVKESTPISVSGSAKSKGARQDDGGANTTVISTGDIMKPARRQREESKNTESTSDIISLKVGKIAQSPSDSAAFSSKVNVSQKTAEKTVHSPRDELSPVANVDNSTHPQLHTVIKEPVNNKPSQTPKAPISPKDDKPIPNPTQESTMKKLHLPRGRSKDDFTTGQDAPSSWLDVDFPKRKLKVPVPKLSSSGSESNLLDPSGDLDDDDFVEKIKMLCAPFSLPPRKHNPLRTPQPPFAMPAIREDRFEKTFDPDEFKFGLRKKNQFTVDTPPSLLSRLQSKENKSALKPARASLTDRSMLLSSLDTHSRLRGKEDKDEEDVKEEKEDQVKVKSRLEGSCVLSSLSSSIYRGKRNEVHTQADGTDSGDVSPSDAPRLSPPLLSQSPPPSPTSSAPLKNTLALSSREEAQAAEAAVSDSGPPLPCFNDFKLPEYLEKYLPQEPALPEQSIQGQEQIKTEVIGKMTSPASGGETDGAVKLPHAVPPCFPEIPPIAPPTLPEPTQPPTQLQEIRSKNIRTVKGFHKRPGKMVLFEKAQFSGQAHEIYRDVADASSLQLSPLISVMVVRGCWVLYEKPGFQGRCVALEEGGTELTNMWAEPGPETEPQNNPAMLIGSIRLAVWDYSLPHIDLFTEPEGHGRVTPYHDDTIETGSFGVPLNTASIQVHSGVWLLFSDPGFQGMISVLERGVYPFSETWGFPSPFVGSLRPLKMGGFKVENPHEVKAVVYEKPGLEGSCYEIDGDVFSFCESEEDIATDGENVDSTKLKTVGSLKIIGGFWVGYSEPGFEGQQYILEEGEYLDCSDWGGSEQLLSLRPIVADFISPHLKMFSDRDFGELGVNIDLTVPVINMDDTGYGVKTLSVDVIGGVWVLFEEPGFCGECYVLEKGLYGCPDDWGALQPTVASAMPVVLDDFENAAKFKVQLFSDPGFQGSVLPLEDDVASLQDGFSVASCKVLAGSWLAFEGQDCTGRMYVLEVGSYPDLRAMGCVNASSSILSLQTVGFEFSLPSITLFERCGLWGKRVILTDGSVNLQLAGGCSRVQSVIVEGGIWILYEGINYRGPQILLKPGEVLDWRKFSSWQKIGSLRPLTQKRVHFRLRNRQSGLMMSVTGDLNDVKLLRVQEIEETDGFEQIWFYQYGHLHCKALEELCLGPSGSITMAGSRVGLTPEPDDQVHLWSITPEGFIRYSPSSDLVLEVKGGVHYDKNQVILQILDPSKRQQQWDVEII
ncbi:LOW QUALITY PROTEIN: beta/gamma crystallin domain-containing protein 1-like [Cottoperca gobio]|uniref:LOW QUALITY PROTEIN: beta/gamma crystallin domain-containing protein 1-like n=1 Tax=Cottoperca gobio TaxID=56716 RepID=A0A6J2P8Z3_COTGO|nr:LOW QUALITY PROTEIN: beta/gamma crystallin domain-containing protein 1-like [Cottoperca gobio]